jgi:hypothetical protein
LSANDAGVWLADHRRLWRAIEAVRLSLEDPADKRRAEGARRAIGRVAQGIPSLTAGQERQLVSGGGSSAEDVEEASNELSQPRVAFLGRVVRHELDPILRRAGIEPTSRLGAVIMLAAWAYAAHGLITPELETRLTEPWERTSSQGVSER